MPRKKSEILEPTETVETSSEVTNTETTEAPKKPRARRSVLSRIAEAVGLSEPEAPAKKAKPVAKAPAAKAVAAPLVEKAAVVTTSSDDLPMPEWRASSRKPPQQSQNGSEDGPRGRSRGRGGRQAKEPAAPRPPRQPRSEEPSEEVVEQVAVERPVVKEPEPVKPFIPSYPAIPTPADAPRVVLHEGIPRLVRNGKALPPIIFFGSSSDEKHANTVFEELKMASENGVHLHSHLIDFEVDPGSVRKSAEFAAYLLHRTLTIDPEAQVIFRVVFRAPRGWQTDYPRGRYLAQDKTTAEPSVCDEAFWNVAADCLQGFIKQLRLLDTNDHIIGLQLDRGEWFFADGWGYDTSQAARDKFNDWCRTRYLNDIIALRASWFDGSVSFDNIEIPKYQPEGSEGDRFVRSSRRQRRYVDYHLFLSDATLLRIVELAHAAKQASEGHFLVGVSYGYTFEWAHPSNGHLGLGKLLRTPEVDFVAGPPSYRTREPGGSAAFPGPIDSFALNGKLFLSEEDFKTSIAGEKEPDDFNPVIKTPQALENVHWRGCGSALAHGSGIYWMDLWGNGWLKTPGIWNRAKRIQDALVRRLGVPMGDPDVIVFIDERALAYLVDPNAFRLLVQNVRESVLKAGMSAGFYLLSDLTHREKFPDAKLYMFLNAWDIRADLRAAIKQRLQRDGKVLFWLYAAGLFESGRDALERAREATGIALKPQPFHSKSGTTIINRRHPLCEALGDRGLTGEAQLEPSYFGIPEQATVLGEYSQTGLPSFLLREFKEGPVEEHWTSVFLGEPLVSPALVRALGQMAGVHVWNFQDDVTHVKAPFLTIHCKGAGTRTIALPDKFSAFNIITNEWMGQEGTSIKFNATDGSTHSFLVGIKEEIQHLLDQDPADLTKVDHIPEPVEEHSDNLSGDFDVPIMRLGEWIEGGDSEDGSDEWLLRPHLLDPDAVHEVVQEEPVGSRRRRRRTRDGRGGEDGSRSRREEGATPDFQDDEVGLSAVFRKRD